MIRTFCQHEIRRSCELTGSDWQFRPLSGEHSGRTFRVCTPNCWETIPGFGSYRGEGEYIKHFDAHGNIRLEFKGIGHFAEVFLDGEKIAAHYNAYTSFDAVIRNLSAGNHTLSVRADNRFTDQSALHVPNDYMSYGGILRPIVMENIGDAFVERIHVTPYRERGKWNARIEVCVRNVSGAELSADLEIMIGEEKLVFSHVKIPGNCQEVFTGNLSFDQVQEWTTDNPVLYTVKARFLIDSRPVDDLIDRFGFREIRVEGKEILLNGKKLRIHGFCRHEDHPQFGAALPFEAMAADLMLLRDLGANAVRTTHYPSDERFLDLCDEEGIIVWEENHARGLSEEQMRNEHFEEQAEQVILEMTAQHYNHPSICIWGILNECASHTEYGRECYRKQLDLLKKLDATRPRSFASCMIKSDICLDLADIVSFNIYPLWYHDSEPGRYLADLYDWVQDKSGGEGKPFLITEIGAGAIYGFRAPHHDKWTEDYQAEALEKQLNAVLAHDGCSGVFIWQFNDVRVSQEWFAGRPRTMNNKGIVDEYRRPKLASNVVRECFDRDAKTQAS